MCAPERHFWKIVGESFLNAKYIFPTQQRDVATIISTLRKDPDVIRVIIFGSSITPACNPWSDIDIYIEYKVNKPLPTFNLGVSVDKWTNFDVDEALMEEINTKGVIVYEQ